MYVSNRSPTIAILYELCMLTLREFLSFISCLPTGTTQVSNFLSYVYLKYKVNSS